MYILKMGPLVPKDNTTILSLPVTVVERNERFSIIDLKAELKHTPDGLVLAEAVYDRMVNDTDLSQKITDGLVAVSVSGGKATFTLGSNAHTKLNALISVPYMAVKGIQRNSLIDLRSYEAGCPEGLTVSDTTYAYLMQNDDFAANITSGKISWSSVDDDGNTEALAVEITKVIPVDADSVADGLADKVIVSGNVNRQSVTLKIYNKDNVEIFNDIVTGRGFFEIEIETGKVQTGQNVTVKAIEGAVEVTDTAVAGDLAYADDLAPVVTITSVTPVDEADLATGTPTKLVVVGSSDELSCVYQIFTSDGTKIDEGDTDAINGSFTADVATSVVLPGDIITVKVIDKAGNIGTATKVAGALSFEETTDPTVEITSATPVNSEYPAGETADKVIIVGSSNEAGAVEVLVGETVIFTGETEQDGSFNLEIVTDLVNAGVDVVVKVTDMAGNVGSDTAAAGTLAYADDLAPVVTITSVTPVDEANPATGTPTKLVVVGSSDELDGVYQIFTSDGAKIADGSTDAVDGSFTASIVTSVIAGDIVTVKVIDKAGNVGTASKAAAAVSFEETTDPTVEVTSVTPVNSEYPAGTDADKVIIVGSSNEAGALSVLVGETVIFTGETEQDGSFNLEIVTDLVNAGVDVVVKVTDMAGNVGSDTATAGTLFKENFVGLNGSAGVTGNVQVAADNVLPNTLAFKVTGDYTIDWGDGIRQNFAAGSVATHTYNYDAISESVGTFALQLPGEDNPVDISVKEVNLGIYAQSGSDLLTLETEGLVDGYPTCIMTDVVLVDNYIDADLAGLFPAVVIE